jgi:hypothetical protein
MVRLVEFSASLGTNILLVPQVLSQQMTRKRIKAIMTGKKMMELWTIRRQTHPRPRLPLKCQLHHPTPMSPIILIPVDTRIGIWVCKWTSMDRQKDFSMSRRP